MMRRAYLLCSLVVTSCSSSSTTETIDGPPAIDSPPAPVDAVPAPIDAVPGTNFSVTLTTAAETPPCTHAGASATGSAAVNISVDGSTVTVSMLKYSGLSGAVQAGHIHFGTAAAPGPVVLPFASVASPINQTFTAADYIAAAGAPADFATFVTMMRAGGAAYINLHTGAGMCPAGEIRGEIQ